MVIDNDDRAVVTTWVPCFTVTICRYIHALLHEAIVDSKSSHLPCVHLVAVGHVDAIDGGQFVERKQTVRRANLSTVPQQCSCRTAHDRAFEVDSLWKGALACLEA